MKYRGTAMHPECDAAIEDICNEAIVSVSEEDISKDNLQRYLTIAKLKEELAGEE